MFYGAFKSQNPIKTLENQKLFLSEFNSLPFDDNVAEIYGSLRAQLSKRGELIGPYDLQIAHVVIGNTNQKTAEEICVEIDEAKKRHQQLGYAGKKDKWAMNLMRIIKEP